MAGWYLGWCKGTVHLVPPILPISCHYWVYSVTHLPGGRRGQELERPHHAPQEHPQQHVSHSYQNARNQGTQNHSNEDQM